MLEHSYRPMSPFVLLTIYLAMQALIHAVVEEDARNAF